MVECLACEGKGYVDLRIGSDFVESIECPHCDASGRVTGAAATRQADAYAAFNSALKDERFKY